MAMGEIVANSIVKISPDAVDFNGGSIPLHVVKLKWVVKSIVDERCVLGTAVSNPAIKITLPIHTRYLSLVE